MRNHRRAEDGRKSRQGNFGEKNTGRRTSEKSRERHAAGRRNYAEPDRAFEENPNRLEGRNAVLEAFRSGRSVDKLYVQADLHEGIISTITREARKAGTVISYVPKERLNQMSETGSHQGVIALAASFDYAEVEDILRKAEEKGEAPFLFLLDGIEDPHNLGAIIRTANLAGAHGVVITRHRAVGLTATVAKASAGAINYTPVAKVTNLAATIEELKEKGMWFVCAAMDGTRMYDLDLKGPIGLVIGNEGEGVSRLVREKCDFTASIPMKGDIDSLNASVAAGVLAYEIVRQRQ
jgi:23S rRNA (guanosine2251-2'-O)-methyltransferase